MPHAAPPPDLAAAVHPADGRRLARAWGRVATRARPVRTVLRLRRADGRYRWFLLYLAADGRTWTTVDVRRADRADDRLALIAHELRNPLAPIRTAVEAIAATPGLPPVARQAGEVIGRQARHLGRLVDDLLDVARIARGQVRLRREQLDLRTVLADAAEAARPPCDARGHTLLVNLPADPLPVDADSDRLRQAFANLLTNAAKYTPDGGRVTLTARSADGSAVVRVCDTGLGLPADQLERVFAPFTQLDGGRDRAAGGLGIGLALVRSLVALHAGTVTAASRGVGCGSTFTVTLPLAGGVGSEERGSEERGHSQPGFSPHSPAPHSPLRLLVVDDHPDAADSLAGLLRLMGHTADVATDGRGGLDAVRATRPDVVLLDLNLPGLSGAEVAAAVRADPALGGVRLVAVSGDSRPPAGVFDACLTKPVGPADLRRVLGERPA